MVCTGCLEFKEISDFGNDRGKLKKRCKQCVKAYNSKRYSENKEKIKENVRQWKAKNPSKVKSLLKSWRIRQYGITIEQYEKMLERCGGLCEICYKSRKLHIDHDHKTGKVRGLLCFDCNTAIGKLGDNPEVILSAHKYLLK